MRIAANTPKEYLENVPEERRAAMTKLRNEVIKNLPKGFEEQLNYGMLGYVVPHSVFPNGYHCDPKLPLPFAAMASQKNFIAFYHMGIYSSPELLEWFLKEYPKHTEAKLDMGKGCFRFKKPEQIPFKLFGELMSKMTAKEWIALYQSNLAKSKSGRPAKKAVKKAPVKKE